MCIRSSLTTVLAGAMVLSLSGLGRADITFDFNAGTAPGWTTTSGIAWFSDGGVQAGDGFDDAWDDPHTTFVFSSPAFYLDQDSFNDLTATLHGGDTRIPAPITPFPANTLFEAGFMGFALRDVATGVYYFPQGRGGNGGSDVTKSITAGQLDTLDQGVQYQLDYIDYTHGGWGWSRFDNVSIPGTYDAPFAASETLVWDGDIGNWAATGLSDPVGPPPHPLDTHWDSGTIPFYTDETTGSAVVIDAGHATVATAAQAAFSVDVGAGGQLSVVGGDMTVMHGLNSSSTAVLTVGGGGVLTADAGTITAVSIGTPAVISDGTISTGGEISATDLTILDNSRLIKAGAGKLSFTGIGAISETGTSIKVTGGGELAADVPPVGVATVELDGGTLSIGLGDRIIYNGFRGSLFEGIPRNDSSMNLDGAAYTVDPIRVPTGAKAGTVLARAEVAGQNITWNGKLEDDNDFNMFAGYSEPDDFVWAFSGTFKPAFDGVYHFRWDVDDRAAMYLDHDGNGIFEAGDEVGYYDWHGQGDTGVLVADQEYEFIWMGQDFGGNQPWHVWMTPPGGSEVVVDSTAQIGQWFHSEERDNPAIAMGGTNFLITQSSTLNATTDSTAIFGGLTLNNGTLTIAGVEIRTTFAGLAAIPAAASVGITSTSDVTISSAVTLGDGASLTLTGETFTVGNVTMSGTTGSIALAGTLNAGNLELPAGTFGLSGSQNYTRLTTTGSPVTIDFGAGGTLTTETFDDQSPGSPRAVNLTGSGTLKFNGGAVTAADTTFGIAGGTKLIASHAAAGPMGAGGTRIQLNGGTFETEGGVVENCNPGLQGSLFRNSPDNDSWMNLGGSTYTFDASRIFTGSKTSTILDPAKNQAGFDIVVNGSIACADNNDWGPFPNLGSDWEHFITAYSGRFFPSENGSYNFRADCDDRAWMWIDMDDNGVFDPGEQVGNYNWRCGNPGQGGGDGHKTLDNTRGYNVVIMGQEFGGGRTVNWWVTKPSGGEDTIDTNDPVGNGGEWKHGTQIAQSISMSNTDFEVTANSDIVATTAFAADFGELTLTNGIVNISGADGGVTFSSIGGSIAADAVTGITSSDPVTLTGTLDIGDRADVTLGGAPLTITGGITLNDAAVGGDGIEEATIRVPSGSTVAWPGAFDQAGVNTRLTKAGAGTLQMQTLGATAANLTTFIARDDGTLEFSGGSVGGSPQLNLDGATVRITGAGSPAPAGAIANWTFDETVGATAFDSSGNGRDGAISGASIGQPGRPGSSGTSYYFSNNADIVTIAAGRIDLSNKSFSLAAWVKREAPNGDYLFGQGTAGNNNALHVGFRDNNNATFAFYGNDSDHVDNAQYEDTSEWHQLVVTYNIGNGMRHIYWDGVDQTPLTNSPTGTPYQGTGAFRIGTRWDGNNNFQGWLDDLYVYDSALTGAQVVELYNASPVIGAINLPGTTIAVSTDSTLDAVTTTTATFGPLRLMEPSVLTTSGAGGGIIFSDTLMAMDAEYGFNTLSDTSPGPITAGTATLVKTGAADLILDPSDPGITGSLTFDVRQGAVVGQAGSNPFGDDSPIKINGGEVVLVAKDDATDPTFDSPVTSTINGGKLTAGRDGDGFARTATIGSLTNHVTLEGGGTLLMETLDGYTLNVGGNISGPGHLTIGAGAVTVAGTLDAGTVTIDGGLTVAGAVNVTSLIANPGGTYSGTSNLTVAQTLTLNGDLDLSGATLVVDNANVTVNGGTLTVGAGNAGNHLGSETPAASVNLSNGGGLALTGTTLTTRKLETTGGVFDMGATGSFIATGDVAAVSVPGLGPVQLELTGGTLSVGGAKPNILLQDDFNDNSIDASKWDVVLAGAPGNPNVTETGERINLASRGHLNTHQQFDPAGGGLKITGTWTMGVDDMLQVLTRSDGVPNGASSGETTNGLEMYMFTGQGLSIRTRGAASIAGGGTVLLPEGTAAGKVFNFEFTDDGTNLSATLTEVGNETNTATTTATSSFAGANLVTFHNREAGGRVAYLDDVLITSFAGIEGAPMNLPGTDLRMASATTINVASDATLGNLSVANTGPWTLTFTGEADLGLNLAGTTFDNPVIPLTINNTPKVNLGPLDLGGVDVPTINKNGTGQWIITDTVGGYTGLATYNINAGTLVLGDPGLIGGRVYMAGDTALKLSSSLGGKTYNETIAFTGNTATILAGMAEGTSAAAAMITVSTVPDLSSQAVTLGTTDDAYTLKIDSAVTSNSLTLTGGGAVTLDSGGSAATGLSVPTGTLNVNNAPIVTPGISVTQTGSLNLSATVTGQSTGDLLVNTTGTVNVSNPLTVTNKITLGEVEITDNQNLEIVGSNLGEATGVLTLSGTTATIGLPPSTPGNGLLGMWTFDDSNASDSSGNGYHGSQYGPLAYTAVETPLGSGKALDLTGGDAAIYVDTGGNQDVFSGYNAMTIAAWAKGAPGGWSPFVCKDEDGWQMRRHGDNVSLDWTTRGLTSSDWEVPDSGPAVNGNWHFVVMTYDGSQKTTYIYGADMGSPIIRSTGATGTITNTQDMLVFGARDNDNNAATVGWQNFLNGYLDDIYFYNRAINQAEVETLYAGGGFTEPIEMPSMNVDLAMTGPSATVTLNGSAAVLGDLTMGPITDLTIATARTASFNNVTVNSGGPTTINNGGTEIGLTVRGTLATGEPGGDLMTDFSVNGDLTMSTGSTLMAFGATVTARNFTNDGGEVGFDEASSLNLTSSTLAQKAGITTFEGGSGATGIDAINVTGGALETAGDVSTGTLVVARGATLNAASPVGVNTVAVIGDNTVATMSELDPAFGVSGSNVVAAHVLTLNGGTMTLSGETTGGDAIMPGGLGLRLWLDAGDKSTVFEDEAGTNPAENGAPVARWNDKSANGFDVTHNNAGQLPQYDDTTNTLNGQATLRFDGDKLGRANDIGITGNADRTVISVWHNATGTGQNYQHTFHHGNSGTTGESYGHSVSRGGNAGEIGNHYWGEGFNSTATTGLIQANIAISTWDGDGAGVDGLDSWYVNGAAAGTYTRAALITGGNEMLIGSRLNGPTEGIRGNIAEVLVFDRILTAEEMNDIGGYLAAKYGITTSYDGRLDITPSTTDLSNTTVVAAASSTLEVAGDSVSLGGIEAADSATLTINSAAPNYQLTNLSLADGSMVKSTLAAATADVTITVSGKLSSGGGKSHLGDPGDEFGFGADTYLTNLTLTDGNPDVPNPVFEWTFTSTAETDVDGGGMMVAVGDSVNVYGTVTMADGLTIQLVDGLAPDVTVNGVDVALFWAIADAVFDPAHITILSPVGAPLKWTWDSLEYVNEEWVVLKNLVTGIHPGDATGDGVVDYADAIAFNAQLGQRGPGLSCDWFADGKIDLLDFQILKDNMGFGTGGDAHELSGSETPEPATMSLLAIGGLLMLRRRRQESR